jgi:hypothetical protein
MRVVVMPSLKLVRALALLLLLAASSMHAIASVGKVMYTYGDVTVETPAVKVLNKRDTVDAGSVIVTGPKGYVQLLLDDGTKIAIRQLCTAARWFQNYHR